jgi:hypothetical protein
MKKYFLDFSNVTQTLATPTSAYPEPAKHGIFLAPQKNDTAVISVVGSFCLRSDLVNIPTKVSYETALATKVEALKNQFGPLPEQWHEVSLADLETHLRLRQRIQTKLLVPSAQMTVSPMALTSLKETILRWLTETKQLEHDPVLDTTLGPPEFDFYAARHHPEFERLLSELYAKAFRGLALHHLPQQVPLYTLSAYWLAHQNWLRPYLLNIVARHEGVSMHELLSISPVDSPPENKPTS